METGQLFWQRRRLLLRNFVYNSMSLKKSFIIEIFFMAFLATAAARFQYFLTSAGDAKINEINHEMKIGASCGAGSRCDDNSRSEQ